MTLPCGFTLLCDIREHGELPHHFGSQPGVAIEELPGSDSTLTTLGAGTSGRSRTTRTCVRVY